MSHVLASTPATRFSVGSNRVPPGASQAKGRSKRQAEFASGRRAAADLLNSFGEIHPVGVNEDRSPAWPAGFVGSISHSDHWTTVVVAQDSALRSIGVDTEPIISRASSEQIREEVATQAELRLLAWLGLSPEATLTLIFSAKESFYKCRYPLDRTFLEFSDVRVVAATANRLSLALATDEATEHLDIHYYVDQQDVFTLTWKEAI
jgi:enterobactin synthetase component D